VTSLSLVVNGRRHHVESPGFAPLVQVLRDELGLTGTKAGCFEGFCGSCIVIVDGATVASCLYPVALADGAEIRTVEGLAGDSGLTPLQGAMLDQGGVQCGICTPGILMTLTQLLETTPLAAEGEIREALAGNICRCTGYAGVLRAARQAAEELCS
jgi:carbon-monoxide dehydrogenase small subunit